MAFLSKRRSVYYIRYCIGGERRRLSTGTSSYQLAKEKLRQCEAMLATGDDSTIPTKTPIASVGEGI